MHTLFATRAEYIPMAHAVHELWSEVAALPAPQAKQSDAASWSDASVLVELIV